METGWIFPLGLMGICIKKKLHHYYYFLFWKMYLNMALATRLTVAGSVLIYAYLDSSINLKLINSKDHDEITGLNQFSGIGLQNVKRRLELLYPNQHKLETLEMEEVFIVDLELKVEDIRNPEHENNSKSDKIIQNYDLEVFNS